MWPTILIKHSACSLGIRLGPWLCLIIVPGTHMSHKHVNFGMFPPTIFHTLISCILWNGKIGMGICLLRTSHLLNFHQTSFLFFETTWQILCASGRCAPRKNGVFLSLQFPKNRVCVARFDITATITLHMYNLSIHDKHERVHRGFNYPANFVWWD